MKRIIHPLLLLLAKATEKELALYIEYLKAENKILRSKLPKRVEVTEAEKATLTKLGVRLGSAIKELITIVHPRTFARWLSEAKADTQEKKARGRPRKSEEIRQLVLDMAKESGWGYHLLSSQIIEPLRDEQATRGVMVPEFDQLIAEDSVNYLPCQVLDANHGQKCRIFSPRPPTPTPLEAPASLCHNFAQIKFPIGPVSQWLVDRQAQACAAGPGPIQTLRLILWPRLFSHLSFHKLSKETLR
jgi:hypothetical protein